ncbi:MAG: hypothetical protein ABIL58_20660 [Pseudomonadota bacterium]
MAANFRIRKTRRPNRLEVALSGDFDGSSAAHLANVLERNRERYGVIRILTDGMGQVTTFGCQVFRGRMAGQVWAGRQCRFAGKWADALEEQIPAIRKAA